MSKIQKADNEPSHKNASDKDVAAYLCVDFVVREGLMFLIIKNLSSVAATDVRISFNQDILILGGTKPLAKLSIFQKLRYLAPYREIELFLDPDKLFFSQFKDKDTVITITISYVSEQGIQLKKSITHDLAIYLDLPTTLNKHQNG